MRIHLRARILGMMGIVCAPGIAAAGPDWTEQPPGAGDLPASAQEVDGGLITSITGELKGPVLVRGVDAPDFEDVYRIFIRDPESFSARTDGLDPGTQSFTQFDSQLWLFDEKGRGLLANNRSLFRGVIPLGSFIAFPADDGSPPIVPAAGYYYLAISGVGNAPSSDEGRIFTLASTREISGPDGPGRLRPIDSWDGPGEFGMYRIALTGAAGSPPCIGDLTGDGAVTSADLAAMLGAWGPAAPASTADINSDGFVNAADLAMLLGAWGMCP